MLALSTYALLPTIAPAQDWTQFHGPASKRISSESIENRKWPEKGPKIAWKVDTKRGFSSVVVAGERAFTLVKRDDSECCIALAVEDGKELWAHPLSSADYDRGGDAGTSDNRGGDGPRSTPSYSDGHLYIFDAQLTLHCLNAKTGKEVWKQDVLADFGGRNIRWQNAVCPLVAGDAVFVAGGGADQSLLAFDKKTGKLLWKAHDEKMTHATPITANIHGVEQILYYVQKGLVAVAPKTGAILWRAHYPYRISSAASPVVDGNVVFVSAGYGVGAAAFEILKNTAKDESDDEADASGADPSHAFRAKLLWRMPNKLMCHWSTPVAKDGYLYGMFSFKKYGKGPMKCVDIRTGDTKWSVDGFGPGNCILVGDEIVAISDTGELVLAAASPKSYEEHARADVLRGKVWSTPSFARGHVYVRSTVETTKIDLSAPDKGQR